MIATYCLYLAVQIFQESWNPRNIKLMVLFMIKFINLLLCCFRNIFKCLSLRKVDTRYSEWKYITVNNNSNKVTTRNRLDFRLNPVPAESGPRRISGFLCPVPVQFLANWPDISTGNFQKYIHCLNPAYISSKFLT